MQNSIEQLTTNDAASTRITDALPSKRNLLHRARNKYIEGSG
jgi:hypothetical protein